MVKKKRLQNMKELPIHQLVTIFSSKIYIFPENSILLAVVIENSIVYNSILLYWDFKIRQKKKKINT